MNTPCLPCEQVPCTFDEPAVIVPCEGGEPCEDIVNAECVEYTGDYLPNIDANPKDRLDFILSKINMNQSSQAILVEDTNTVHLSGNGLSSSKLKADTILDPNVKNIITKNSAGLLTVINHDIVESILILIRDTPDLGDILCELIANCNSNNTCGIPTGLTAEVI